MIISNHFKSDRADRYTFIVTEVGLGKVIHSHKQAWTKHGEEPCIVDITSTGVAIVKTYDDVLVTMYVLTLTEAEKYFNDGAMPFLLTAIIKSNMKKRLHILQNQIKY